MAMKAAAIACLLVLLASCGTLEKKAMLINVGDNKQRVLDIMGTPGDRQVHGYQEAWQYCVSGAGFGYDDYRLIWFANGKVTGITSYKASPFGRSCTSDFKTIRWENAPDQTIEIRER